MLDPFGGSGVTAIESFLENRIGIQNDINPLANFIAQGVADLSMGDVREYQLALALLKERCKDRLSEVSSADERQLNAIRESVDLPEDVALPSNSDVTNYHALFTPKQLISLSILRNEIGRIRNRYARNGMLLSWSATLGKLNKTFLSAEGRAASRGGSSIFSIYRYKVAANPVELPPWETFHERALNIIAAKREIDSSIDVKVRTSGWLGRFEVQARDIEDLSKDLEGSIDYIFTDPPYGGHISYLDLSTLWNSWLGLTPSLKTRKKELIVGGELQLSEESYISRLGDSMQACLRMLKKGRWLSVVFQHWNVEYFKAILTSCAQEGAELKAAISQVGDPIWSMHKKKNKESVLGGELILTFFKSGRRLEPTTNNGFDIVKSLGRILSLHRSDKLYGESLFNKLVIEAWKSSAIDSINMSKEEFVALIQSHGWEYDERNHYWVKNQIAELPLFQQV